MAMARLESDCCRGETEVILTFVPELRRDRAVLPHAVLLRALMWWGQVLLRSSRFTSPSEPQFSAVNTLI